jgi:hypothetical protein
MLQLHNFAHLGRGHVATHTRQTARPSDERKDQNRPSKKDQILALAASGLGDVADIAMMTQSRPSYVATVLQDAGAHAGYFDLYTSTAQPMNVYSKFFAGQLGFKDVEIAKRSVELIDRLYRQFELAGDRAGQHHALLMALTMFDRARWTEKGPEADQFRRWLVERLEDASPLSAAVRPNAEAEHNSESSTVTSDCSG